MCIDIKENDFKDFAQKIKDMPKFDYIVQNPPYSKSLHLMFFNKCLDILENDGKLVIIEPALWLIQLKENAKYTKSDSITEKIKKRINEHVYKVNIQNFNNEFGIANKTVISITYIDFSKKYNKIDFTCITEHKLVNSIYDCNLIGENKLVKNILNKALLYKDHMINHCINLKNYIDYEDKGYWFIPYGNYMINSLGSNRGRNAEMFYQDDFETHTVSEKTKFGIYYSSFVNVGSGNKIYYNLVPKSVKRGSPCDCIFSKNENDIQNWKYYIRNNKLPLFINICLTVDEHNNVKNYLPWLVDKKYTDEEIYKLLDITKEEQELIDKTIKKYERSSIWCRQYMLGPSSISNEEV